MNMPRKPDMIEATRLTRLGRLEQAMALLRGTAPAQQGEEAATSKAQGKPRAWSPSDLARRVAGVFPGGATAKLQTDKPRTAQPSVGDALGGKVRRESPPAPGGARFEETTFSNASGRRAFKLYVPSGYHGQPVPLVVMLHGCTQSPDDFAAGTRMNALAEEQVFLVAYPAQAQSANVSKCWNWFQTGHQQRDQGEPSLIAGITRQIMREYAVEEGRVYIAGLSAGGAAAAIMGAAYPDLYAALGVHSGLACGAAADAPSAFAAMSQGGKAPRRQPAQAALPTIVFHGDADRTVSPVNGDQVIAQSKAGAAFRTSVSEGRSDGGVAYRRTVHADSRDVPFLEQWVLHGAGHAWSGGSAAGSYTDPRGPDASREMMRFFLQHRVEPAA